MTGKSPTRAPRGRIQRASIWSHRSQRDRASTDISFKGFGDIVHRVAEKNRHKLGPYVSQRLTLGLSCDIVITYDLSDAERMHTELGQAIEEAKASSTCTDSCLFCEEDHQ